MADPNVALRWNWNTPFFLSVHDPNVFYSGADKVFKSSKKGRDPIAISPDLSAHDPEWVRVSSGFDAEGNAATDGSGGITRDATGAEENATIAVMNESPIRAGMLFIGTDDGKVWITPNDGGKWIDISDRYTGVPAMTHVSGVEPSHADYVDDLRRARQPPSRRLQAVRLRVERFRKDVPVDRVEPAERLARKRVRDSRRSRQRKPVVRRYRDWRVRVARTRGRAGSRSRATCRPFRSMT